MTTDEDMERTFHDIATAGLQVVRTWAFNDVSQKPASGTYFQVRLYYKSRA
jgi:mannan endo-1,4-beta-mannosidase